MVLQPKGHYSSLRDKNQAFGANLVSFTRAKRGVIGGPVFLQERDNLLSAQVNKMKIRWEFFFY